MHPLAKDDFAPLHAILTEPGVRRYLCDDKIYWYFHEPPRLELPYALLERVWKRGYGSEAARRMIDYGREQLGMATILASTDTPNLASIRVLERLGFTLTDGRMSNDLDTSFFSLPLAP